MLLWIRVTNLCMREKGISWSWQSRVGRRPENLRGQIISSNGSYDLLCEKLGLCNPSFWKRHKSHQKKRCCMGFFCETQRRKVDSAKYHYMMWITITHFINILRHSSGLLPKVQEVTFLEVNLPWIIRMCISVLFLIHSFRFLFSSFNLISFSNFGIGTKIWLQGI